MAKDRPILGWGPDTFGYLAPTYQTQKFVDAFGPNQVINAAHNTFLQTLATKGVLGLAALLFFLVWLALRSIGAWRNTRARERTDEGWREHRLMLTAALGATLGVLLQNSFNVELLGVNIVLWAMAGVVSTVALAVGVPVGLNPARIVRVTPFDETATPQPAASAEPTPGTPLRRRGAARDRRGRGRRARVVLHHVVARRSLLPGRDRRHGRAHLGHALVGVAVSSRELDAPPLRRRDEAEHVRVALPAERGELHPSDAGRVEPRSLPTTSPGSRRVRAMFQTAVDRGPRDPVPLSSYARSARSVA